MNGNGESIVHYLNPRQYEEILPRLEEIEKKAAVAPWGRNTLKAALKKRNYNVMIAEVDGQIAGHLIYERHPRYF